MNTNIGPSPYGDNHVGFLTPGTSATHGGKTMANSDVASSVTEEIEVIEKRHMGDARPVSQGSDEGQASLSSSIPTSDPRPDSATFNRRQVQMLSICIFCSNIYTMLIAIQVSQSAADYCINLANICPRGDPFLCFFHIFSWGVYCTV
jgi:hypothetical protein